MLLAGSQPEMTFAWVGEADEAVLAVLKAAQVNVLPCEDAGAEARHFAQAWLYLAPMGDAEDAAGLIEAMACAGAIVASDTEPVREVITEGETGRLVNFFDGAALVDRVCELLDDPQQRARLGRNARETAVSRYDLKSVCLPAQMDYLRRVAAR